MSCFRHSNIHPDQTSLAESTANRLEQKGSGWLLRILHAPLQEYDGFLPATWFIEAFPNVINHLHEDTLLKVLILVVGVLHPLGMCQHGPYTISSTGRGAPS